MFNRGVFASKLMRVARTTTTAQCRRMGSNANHGDHHHGPVIDTAYTDVNKKFNLPPIPKDGIHRRARIDMNAYGPFQSNADAYIKDPSDMVPFFDRHLPSNITPHTALKHATLFIGSIVALHLGTTVFIGDDKAIDLVESSHPGPLPHLMSAPHVPARQLTVDLL